MDLNKNDIKYKKSTGGVLTLNNAKINGIDKSSLNITGNDLTFTTQETNTIVKNSIQDIDFLIYAKGNFFIDDKIFIGIKGEQYEISCKKNEIELRIFYEKLVKAKENQKQTQHLLQQPRDENLAPKEDQIEKQEKETSTLSTSEEIRNFYNLMKDGIISEEEFEEKKKELLKPK